MKKITKNEMLTKEQMNKVRGGDDGASNPGKPAPR